MPSEAWFQTAFLRIFLYDGFSDLLYYPFIFEISGVGRRVPSLVFAVLGRRRGSFIRTAGCTALAVLAGGFCGFCCVCKAVWICRFDVVCFGGCCLRCVQDGGGIVFPMAGRGGFGCAADGGSGRYAEFGRAERPFCGKGRRR